MSNDHTSHPTSVDVTLSRTDAERARELLRGLAAILRAEPSEDPLDILAELDQAGVLEPLRYGRPMAGPYVAEVAEDVARRLKGSLEQR